MERCTHGKDVTAYIILSLSYTELRVATDRSNNVDPYGTRQNEELTSVHCGTLMTRMRVVSSKRTQSRCNMAVG